MREHEEAELYGETRRAQRKERKMAVRGDRSKYKVTDQKQRNSEEAATLPEGLVTGKVLMIRSHEMHVRVGDQERICTLRGTLKQGKDRKKNLIVVGDDVLVQTVGDKQGVIWSVLPRRSVLSRLDNLDRIKEHLIAANIDKLFITTSVVSPVLRINIIDRYLIAAERGNLKPILIINKIDLLPEAPERDQEYYTFAKELYQSLGFKVIPASIVTGEGLEEIKTELTDSVSVFSGQSGTGKSSLINAITGLKLRTAPTVVKTNKGSHTTTYAELLQLPFGGYCVDTPGVKSFGLWGLQACDVASYFPEIEEASKLCAFRNCTHRGDEGCGLQAAIDKGLVSEERYLSYFSLLQSIEDEHLRR